ncbi:YjbQ family protein [Enterococcus quebecensis]|uniref:Secondary thiamine-phosphate synthase enzyme n=1 Tax=Enterococcus quebecensis TaxID=903983 RepID=A0A1E5GUH4_9ENTE|nr:YjbQ family protein [Enterococcus quebecensis]OEG16344.1 hypothetical protein BCR23_05500 [Enterococcus quebecensis]
MLKQISVFSEGFEFYQDITSMVNEHLMQSVEKDGMVSICAKGSTTALVTMRFEKGVIKDLLFFLEKLYPSGTKDNHFELTRDPNGMAHIKNILLGNSQSLAYMNRKLILPEKHRLVFFDFDLRTSQREIYLNY